MGHNRTNSKSRCPSCRLAQIACICSYLKPLSNRTPVLLLVHRLELKKSTNTGLLAQNILSEFKICIRGVPGKEYKISDFLKPDFTPLVLYPGEDAKVLNRELIDTLPRPPQLIVPDGNWRQASKACHREKELGDFLKVKLPMESPTIYKLRRTERENGLSTFESITRAIEIIEGGRFRTEMDKIFDLFVQRILWCRGKLQGPLPEGPKDK